MLRAQPNYFVEIPASTVRPGMFIARLDRPWLETPFAVQGFFVERETDIQVLANHCSHVYVDPKRSKVSVYGRIERTDEAEQRKPPGIELKAEITRARADFRTAQEVIGDAFTRIRSGAELNLARVAKALDPVIDSVLRNQDAMAMLARVKQENDYTFSHCLACAVWSAVLGRHLALDRPLLEKLVLGTALIDIGKAQLPAELLARAGGLTADESTLMRGHVARGLEMLRRSGSAGPEVLAIVEFHHERHDGSGYPHGLSGSQIPLPARIAGMVDAYDAMITPRPWTPARSSFEAIQELQDLADTHFQRNLVEQFTAAIGLFPTGSIVELNTGEVGIVTRQNPVRRLRPELVLVLDADKNRRDRYLLLDLMQDSINPAAPVEHWIARELPRGSYGINAEDFYL